MHRRVAAGLLVFALTGLLAGCGGTAGSGGYKVGMATDVGGLGDKSFNDSAYAGLKRAEKDLGAKIQVVESKKQEDYVPNLSTLKDGNNTVWAIGFLMTDAVAKVATDNPKTNFGLIDGVPKTIPANLAAVTFKEEEGSFLVGLLAGKATKTNKIGFVGGGDFDLIWKFEAGFRAGVKAANPNATVERIYTGVFDSPDKGKEAALTLFGKGADVIYAAAGACGIGVINAAKDKGLLAIGVDSDQNGLAPQNVLSSMMKRVDNAVFSVSKLGKDGSFPGGKITTLGLKEGGVGVSDTTLWEKAPGGKDLVAKWSKAIIDGKAVVPTDRDKVKDWTVPAI